MKKLIIAVLAIMLVVCISIGATLAYLFVDTTPVVNTFAYGDINITLDESKDLELKMIPGNDIAKDPKVTVLKDSEACWLFVKIDESENFDDFMTYAIADGWKLHPSGGEGSAIDTDELDSYVIYREVGATTADTPFQVLSGDKVTVKTSVLKTELNALTNDTKPTLTFTAYAVQKANVDSAAEAWTIAQNKGSDTTAAN